MLHQVAKNCGYDQYKIIATPTNFVSFKYFKKSGGTSGEEAVGWTIAYPGNSFPEALQWAGKELKLIFPKERMDVNCQQQCGRKPI